jgi:hypothetical protein
VVVQGAPLAGAHESSASQTLPPAKARKKCATALAPIVDAPAPCAGDGAASPNGWTNQPQGDEADAPRMRGQERNDWLLCCVSKMSPSTKDIVRIRVRTELI